jgi:hypothetical protein
MKDYFGDDWITPSPQTYSMFKNKNSVHLAQRIFVECMEFEGEVYSGP